MVLVSFSHGFSNLIVAVDDEEFVEKSRFSSRTSVVRVCGMLNDGDSVVMMVEWEYLTNTKYSTRFSIVFQS